MVRTMTWNEVLVDVKARYDVRQVRADSISLRWNGAGTERVGPQKLVLIDAWLGRLRWLTIFALVGPEGCWAYRDVLVANGSRLIGDVVLKEDSYLFRISAVLDTLAASVLAELIDRIAGSSTELRARLVPPRVDLDFYRWIED